MSLFLGPSWTAISRPRYYRFQMISSGAQGIIYLSGNLKTLRFVVEKVLWKCDIKQRQLAVMEALCGDAATSSNLLKVIESPTLDHPVAILEWCNGGNLAILIDRYAEPDSPDHVPEIFVEQVFIALAKAVNFICTRRTPVVHEDIKPANVVLSQNMFDTTVLPFVKLCDFNMADFYNPEDQLWGGTYEFQPPEQWADPTNPRATLAGDVWAVRANIQELTRFRAPNHILVSLDINKEMKIQAESNSEFGLPLVRYPGRTI